MSLCDGSALGRGSWQVVFRGLIAAVEDTPLEHDVEVDIAAMAAQHWAPPSLPERFAAGLSAAAD